MSAVWDWFVREGGVKDLLGTGIAVTVAHIIGWRPRRHMKTQEQIADRLDTSTPGGLADILPKEKEDK